MEFNEVIDRRRTSREWTDKEVAFDVIKRILAMPNILRRNLTRADTKTGSSTLRKKCMLMLCRGSIQCLWTVRM